MNYNLTEKQQEGLDICLKRYKQKKPYTIIAGYAGTGKSYLVNAIVDAFNFKENEVAYAAYTGKAASVLQKQGKNAVTLHRLLYYSYPNGMGGFINRPRKELEQNYKLIVIDEISMCSKEIWDLLLSHHIYVIGLGDPFQLPPINDDQNLHLLDYPHIFLDEVMRQALDNDIIKYSMDLREGKELVPGIVGKNIRTYSKEQLTTSMMLWADQILCGKNETRANLNRQMREELKKENILSEDDKLICIRNYWDKVTPEGNFLVNGTVGYAKKVKIFGERIYCTLEVDENNLFYSLPLDYTLLSTGKPKRIVAEKGKRVMPNYDIQLDYGYAITVHKSQGSQFDKVLVYDEHLWNEENHNRWLYTAITRAIEKVVVIL